MRTLSSTLAAAARSDSRAPYVQALFDDYDGDRPRLRWTQYYAGSETEFYCSSLIAPDGSLVRARVDAGNIYVDRIASPSSASTFSNWTSLTAAAGLPMALVTQNSGSIMLFYVKADVRTIAVRSSTDNGATWGAEVGILVAPANVTYLTASAGSSSDWYVFWAETATVYWTYSGAFGVRTAWTNGATSITGLAVTFNGDFCLEITGRETTSGDQMVWVCFFGYGVNQAVRTWGALVEVSRAASASGVTFGIPAVTYLSAWWLFYREDYSGSLAYAREHWSSMDGAETFTNEKWREPQAFRANGAYVFSVAVSATALWIISPSAVWYAPLSLSQLDLSDRVLEADVDLDPFKGVARVLIDNADGQIARGTSSGLLIVPGRRLTLAFGYRTTAGVEVSSTATGPSYWVDSVEWVHRNDGRAVVEVIAYDGWRYLEAWVARREFVFAAGARLISQLLAFVCGRAGLTFTALSSSAALTALSPAYSIHAGQNGLAAVRALMGQVPDKIYMYGGAARNLYPQSSDASAYSFGTTHAIVAGTYRIVAAKVTRARAFGPALLLNEQFDLQDAEDLGERVSQLLDVNLTTTTLAGNRAGYMLRDADYEQEADEIVVPLQPGLEMYDVVDVTDSGAGLAAAKRRVRSLRYRHRAGKGRPVFEVTLTLSAV